MKLGDFLLAAAAGRSPWNCSTMPADWCVALGYPDFAARWRDIADPEECSAIAAGDLLSLWDQGIGEALPVASEPFLPGDIGVIGRAGLQAGAIFTGERWMLRAGQGLTSLTLPAKAIIKAWRP